MMRKGKRILDLRWVYAAQGTRRGNRGGGCRCVTVLYIGDITRRAMPIYLRRPRPCDVPDTSSGTCDRGGLSLALCVCSLAGLSAPAPAVPFGCPVVVAALPCLPVIGDQRTASLPAALVLVPVLVVPVPVRCCPSRA